METAGSRRLHGGGDAPLHGGFRSGAVDHSQLGLWLIHRLPHPLSQRHHPTRVAPDHSYPCVHGESSGRLDLHSGGRCTGARGDNRTGKI
jgi:hypothetical protein